MAISKYSAKKYAPASALSPLAEKPKRILSELETRLRAAGGTPRTLARAFAKPIAKPKKAKRLISDLEKELIAALKTTRQLPKSLGRS
jgi:hypothetical protein